MRSTDLNALDRLQHLEIPGVLCFTQSAGGLTRAAVTTPWSQAEVYLQGAQVTGFQISGAPPLLFLSQASRFEPGKAIRGGVPICFPWFGRRAGDMAHGFARTTEWALQTVHPFPGGGVRLDFHLPPSPARTEWASLQAVMRVSVTSQLGLELVVTHAGADQPVEFEACFHSYFAVGDVGRIAIHGLEGATFLDHLQEPPSECRSMEPVRITAQTDRTYRDTTSTVWIEDSELRRRIRLAKSGSASTVVWNPWTTQPLADLAPGEYRRMVCVESGNVSRNRVRLPPGGTSHLHVTISGEEFQPH